MNTARWATWVAMLKESDSTLVQLATMAAAAVLIWESLGRVPEPWQERARSAYLLVLLILFVYLIGGQMNPIGFFVSIAIVFFVAGGSLAVWQVFHKAAPVETAGNSTVENQEAE